MQRYTVFYLETALHVLGGTSTHPQEHKQLYLQHLVFVTPLLLSASIVEELELVLVCCGWRTPLPIKMEQTECSETSAYKIQTPENYPEESIQLFPSLPSFPLDFPPC